MYVHIVRANFTFNNKVLLCVNIKVVRSQRRQSGHTLILRIFYNVRALFITTNINTMLYLRCPDVANGSLLSEGFLQRRHVSYINLHFLVCGHLFFRLLTSRKHLYRSHMCVEGVCEFVSLCVIVKNSG